LLSQNKFSITGTVLDENGKPFPYVNISLKNTRQCTISNLNGWFTINFPGQPDVATLSHIGYESYNTKIDSTTKSLQITLKTAIIQLKEVLVTNVSASELLNKAISKIPDNYSQDKFLAKMFYRAKIHTNKDSLLYVEEAAFEQVKSYRKGVDDKTFLIKNRNFNFKKNSRVAISGIGDFDVVKTLMNDGKTKKNKYTYGISTSYEGRSVYVLEINKDVESGRVTKGKIYIDANDLAFIRFELNENGKKINLQYKKFDTKYFFVSEIASNKNNKLNGGFENVSSEIIMTELIQHYENQEINGFLIKKEDVLQGYPSQNDESSFWRVHNEVLPDSATEKEIAKYLFEQKPLNSENIAASDFKYDRLYNPHLKLMFSTQTPKDLENFSKNTTSFSLLTNYFLEKNIKNMYVGLLGSVLLNEYIMTPLEEVEVERYLTSSNNLKVKSIPTNLNSLNESYLYGLSNQEMNTFKASNYTGFMRLHYVRNEYHYLKTKILEEDIAKADMANKNNKFDFIKTYLLDLVFNRCYNIFYSPLKDKYLKGKDKDKAPLFVDRNKSWVKYLFDQNSSFESHITSEQLTTDEKHFLKRTAYLSWLNILSPQLLGFSKFNISDYLKFTFSVNYLRVPFGEMVEQNIWLTYEKQLNGLFFRQYINNNKASFGLGYKLYDTPIQRNIYLTSTVDYWLQPKNLNFYDESLKSGIHLGQEIEYRCFENRFSKLNKISVYAGYDFKTNGYLPENLSVKKQFKINIGAKINF